MNNYTPNFTPRAQQTLALARKEADRLSHNFVATEHILLGLIQLGQGTAVTALEQMGIDLENVRQEVEQQLGPGRNEKDVGNIPYTPRVKKTLALAAKEAVALDHSYVGTEHILLGLLLEGDGVAFRVLKQMGVEVEQTRLQILKVLDPNFHPAKRPSKSAVRPSDVAPGPSERGSTLTSSTCIDVSKRYDIYCRENDQMVVYRNARFKSRKKLLQREDGSGAEFLEMEQSNGQSVFVSFLSVIRFCEPGTEILGENV
jgi:ATP-dependent Clp protease ATP-binding subunit ClpA